MELEREFQRNRSDSPRDLIIGLVASILLHSILFIEANNWLQVFAPEHKRETEPIPIQFVEVPPKEAKPPKETKLRAANDSVASGKAKPKQPVSAATLVTPVKPKASDPKNYPAQKPASSVPRATRSTVVLPNRYPQEQQAISKKTALLPTISKLKPKPQKTTAVTTTPESKPEKTVVVPVTPKPHLTQTDKNNLLPPKSASEQLENTTTPKKTQSQAQRSQISGAASRLGGAVTLSSRNLGGSYLAAMPNSNRFNQGASGIDARRDVNMGSYLQQLQQRVRQQWIPGLTDYSQRTVVYFVVSRSGQVSNLRIVKPSGSKVIDSAALSAVERAAPFAPLPIGYSDDYINIRFTFNINVSGELDLSVR